MLDLTEQIVDEHKLTTLMVTHNMNGRHPHGNRLIMMHEGHIIYGCLWCRKGRAHCPDLLQKFEEVLGRRAG